MDKAKDTQLHMTIFNKKNHSHLSGQIENVPMLDQVNPYKVLDRMLEIGQQIHVKIVPLSVKCYLLTLLQHMDQALNKINSFLEDIQITLKLLTQIFIVPIEFINVRVNL